MIDDACFWDIIFKHETNMSFIFYPEEIFMSFSALERWFTLHWKPNVVFVVKRDRIADSYPVKALQPFAILHLKSSINVTLQTKSHRRQLGRFWRGLHQ